MCVTPAGKIGNWTCGIPKSLPYSGIKITPSFSPSNRVKSSILTFLFSMSTPRGSGVLMLGSYGRQNQTKKALWELDNLYRTLYILTYIDEVGLRQSVQKALNRGEAYHRFRRAISYVNAGKF